MQGRGFASGKIWKAKYSFSSYYVRVDGYWIGGFCFSYYIGILFISLHRNIFIKVNLNLLILSRSHCSIPEIRMYLTTLSQAVTARLLSPCVHTFIKWYLYCHHEVLKIGLCVLLPESDIKHIFKNHAMICH